MKTEKPSLYNVVPYAYFGYGGKIDPSIEKPIK